MVRQRMAAVLMMLCCLLLASCGTAEKGTGDAQNFRTSLQEAGGCKFSAEVEAIIGDAVHVFAMDAVYHCGDKTELTVTAPETIHGIRAELTEREAMLSFDGVALDFGYLDDAMSSPLYAPLVLGQSWDTAYIDCGGMEGTDYRVTYRLGYESNALTTETWFSEGVPIRAEIYRGTTQLLSASIKNFTFLT